MIAVFDLDRTVTTRNTFSPWLLGFVRRQPWRLVLLPDVVVAAAAFWTKILTRRQLKQVLLRCFVAGQPPGLVAEVNAEFVAAWIPYRCRPGALAAIARHRIGGDIVVLATASTDVYVLPFAKALGVGTVVATRCETDADGRLTGRVVGANCYGAQKLQMVKTALEPVTTEPTVVYSDHHSDWPLLAWADQGVAIQPGSRLRRLAAAHGMDIRDWN